MTMDASSLSLAESSLKTPWADIPELRLTTVEGPATFDPAFVVVRSGVGFRLNGGRQPILGFACDRDLGRARARARGEVYEHLLLAFARGLEPSEEVSVQAVDGRIHELLRGDVVLPAGEGDATGYAFRRRVDEARLHAWNEMVERALCADVWYGERQVELERVTPSLTIARFDDAVLSRSLRLAFLYDKERELLTAGSSVKGIERGTSATQHAVGEATMVHDSVAKGGFTAYVDREKSRRYASLQGGLAEQRWQHIQSLAHPRRSRTSPQIPALGGNNATRTAEIVRCSAGVLVRTWSTDEPALARARRECRDVVSDPFC